MSDEMALRFEVRYLYGGMGVDAAGISVKVGAHYPGRSAVLSVRADYCDRETVGEDGRSQPRA